MSSVTSRGLRFTVLYLALGFLTYSGPVFAQEPSKSLPDDWFIRDPETDSVQGLSVEKTYNTLLAGKKSKTVLVAVIDSGIDIDHEDLKDVLWRNEDEIPGNGIDDDKNGYIDDVYGWNFIGGKEGNVGPDTYEVTREYKRLKPRFESVKESAVSKKDKAEYELWKKVKAKYDNDFGFNKKQYDEVTQQFNVYQNAFVTIRYCDSLLQAVTGKPVLKSTLESIPATDERVQYAKQTLIKVGESIGAEDINFGDLVVELANYVIQLAEGVEHYQVAVEYGYNLDFDSRKIVGDNPTDLTEKYYGNNDVEGPDPKHGTHVAGIIAANRKNTLGMKGIADDVRIMSVRAVPNGDERDKDVANAIIYAVDNGAKVINMSFGKSFSPNKELVDKAVKYAESKGVLLIHAAGNDADNNDEDANFPNKYFAGGGEASNWVEIGASAWGADENFVASFSNYGKKSVDLFSPGVEIYSTTPDNTYERLQGTSMASPATAGVAALLLSYFPDLTATQVKEILRNSTRKFSGLKVIKPGTTNPELFSNLSSSGGLVNAYEAVKLAMTYQLNKKK